MTNIDQSARCIGRVLTQNKTMLQSCYSPTDPQFDGVIIGVNAALVALSTLVMEIKRLEAELEQLRQVKEVA